MLRIHIDNLKTAKKDEKSLLFSVYIQYDEVGAVLIPGWRLKNSTVSPPAMLVSSSWYPTVYVTEALGELIYKELRKVVPKSFPGVTISFDETPLRSLLDDAVKARLMPGVEMKVHAK